ARHYPVGDRLLEVLERLGINAHALRLGIEAPRRNADFQCAAAHHIASVKIRSKSSRAHGRGLVLWEMSSTATSSSLGRCWRVTFTALSLAGMPTSCLSAVSQATNASALAAAEFCATPTACAIS